MSKCICGAGFGMNLSCPQHGVGNAWIAPEPEPRPSESCNREEWDTATDEGGTLLGLCACGVPMADHEEPAEQCTTY